MAEYTDPIPNASSAGSPAWRRRAARRCASAQLAQATIRGFFSFADEAAKQRGGEAFMELAEWVREMAADRRRSPREDLITDLVRARDRGEAMSDDEIIILVAGLLGAGSETTAIGGMVSMLTLLDHPEALERLRADRRSIPAAVNEILRFAFGGGGGLPRYAVRDFELRGKTIRKGQMLLLSFTGAHRDPSVFPDPDRFDIDARHGRAHRLRPRPALLPRRPPRARRAALHGRRRARFPAARRPPPPRPGASGSA